MYPDEPVYRRGRRRSIVLSVEDLSVDYTDDSGRELPVLTGVNLSLAARDTTAIVGRSGCGKTTLVHALVGLLADNARIRSGQVLLHGQDLLRGNDGLASGCCGGGVALIPQEPGLCLHPKLSIGRQLSEVLRTTHGIRDRDSLRQRVTRELAAVQLDKISDIASAYPHQLSGGQRQRVAIALAFASSPSVILADEPASSLDQESREHFLDLLETYRKVRGGAVLLISHDAGLVSQTARRILELRDGHLEPKSRRTHTGPSLPERLPSPTAESSAKTADIVLRARSLTKEYRRPRGLLLRRPAHRVLDAVDLCLHTGSRTALVGPNGCGKSTLALCLAGHLQPTGGSVQLCGDRPRTAVQLVFQDSSTALSPVRSALETVEEPLRWGTTRSRSQRNATARAWLASVGLPPDRFDRKPHALSGGERQRVALARCLAANPDLILLDEPFRGLDDRARTQLAALISELSQSFGFAYLLITHEEALAAQLCDRILRLRNGKLSRRALPDGEAPEIKQRTPEPEHEPALLAREACA